MRQPESIIPTTTGAAKAVSLVLPELKGKLNGGAMRVPTPNVSLVDLVAELDKEVTAEEVNAPLKEAQKANFKAFLATAKSRLYLKTTTAIQTLLQSMLFLQWLWKATWLKLFLGMTTKADILTVLLTLPLTSQNKVFNPETRIRLGS